MIDATSSPFYLFIFGCVRFSLLHRLSFRCNKWGPLSSCSTGAAICPCPWVRSLAWEDPLEKRMATHSSNLAWRTPWTEEPGGPQLIDTHTHTHTHTCGFFWRKQSFYSSGISNRHLIYLTYWKQGFMTIHLLCTSKYTKPAGPQSSGTLLTQGCSGVLCRHENSGQDHGQELATASTRTGRSELDSGGAQVLPHPWKVTNR